MAQKVNIVLIDDIDGNSADETVSFALDGSDYAIDLSHANAQKLRDVLAPYIAHGRRESARRGRRGGAASGGGAKPSDVRDWARSAGYTVPDRGRIPSEIKDAYEAAH